MMKLKIALQKSGRLSEKSLNLFNECGIKIPSSSRKLRAEASNFPVEFLFLRDNDIPYYVEQGIADIGIIGENEVWEQKRNIDVTKKLGFANCRLALAIPRDKVYNGISYFNNKHIATSYPNILKNYFDDKGVKVGIEELSGSVEIATGIGLADGVFDIVSSGSTLLMNGLKEVEVIAKSEAVLIANKSLNENKQDLLNQIIFRINAVKSGSENKYILLNAPNTAIDDISKLLPGVNSPTILPLGKSGWSSLHSVIREFEFWDIIDQLKKLGAQGILVVPIEKMIA